MSCPIRFFAVVPGMQGPIRADSSLGGSASQRSVMFCHPFTTANGFGWHAFPPKDLDLTWDGSSTYFREPNGEWERLTEFVDVPTSLAITQAAPLSMLAYAPIPLLGSAPEHGLIQLWTGLFASSAQGWSLLLRPLVNHPGDDAFDVLEGLIETDWWFGPLVVPLRFKKTDRTIELRRGRPLLQMQPVRRESYADTTLGGALTVGKVDDLSAEDWCKVQEAISLRMLSGSRGSYRMEAHRRQRDYAGADFRPEDGDTDRRP